MRPLRVTRFLQDPSHCAIGACAAVANYHNREVDYDVSKAICYKYVQDDLSDGLYTGQSALLLNHLGFKSVEIVTSDITILDYTWKKLSKKNLAKNLTAVSKNEDLDASYREHAGCMAKFLRAPKRNNKITIDYRFAKHIRESLDDKHPAVISFNWTMYFEFGKENEKGKPDPNGDYSEHAVVARGYNNECIHIVDSHWAFYKYKLSKYREGYYTMKWEDFLTCAGMGDVIIPRDYDPDLMSKI